MAYRDKNKEKDFQKRYYQANKETIKKQSVKSNKANRERNKKYIKDYLLEHPCVDCGEKDVIVLEFDHVRGKKLKNVAEMANGSSLNRIAEEIAKCEVRCANCHRRATHYRRINKLK